MVTDSKKYFLFVLILAALLFGGCRNDIFGMFGSTDLDWRWQDRNTFHFLGAAGREVPLGDTYSFIVLTDTHIENGNAHGLERLKDVIDSDVKFVVIAGDITQSGNEKDIKKYIEVVRDWNIPCYPVVGNHDVFFGNWQVWKEHIGSTVYRVDGGGATLFILDSANGYFGASQLDWLERELKRTTGRVFVFSHVNLFVKSPVDIQQFTDTRERARIVSLLNGRCDMMFMGHVHRRIIHELGSVRYITIEDFRGNSVYCQVWVSKDNIRYEFKKL